MRVPQVNERVKEAPAHALRAMFAGIGQLLLVTDRLRSRVTGKDEAPAEGAAPAQATPTESAARADEAAPPATAARTEAAPAAAPAPAAEAPAAAEPATSEPSGNVRLLSGEEGQEQAATASTTSDAPAAAAPPEGPVTTAAEAPLPNYDELTIASLRARLRNLTTAQLRELIEYEKAHANRSDVISMFERRIAKLEG
jgi:hypothetical protein